MDQRQIRDEIDRLDHERREEGRRLMAEYDRTHYPKRRDLQLRCEMLGHADLFTHTGPLGHPWFQCRYCRRSVMKED